MFVKSAIINAPVETVFAFHERPDALQLLSPSIPPIRVIRKVGGIETGSQVEIGIGPFTWVALHTKFERNHLFEDTQVSGPFAQWIHRHEFEALGSATRLTDRIEYRLPGGVLVNSLFGWATQLALGQMFRHRHLVTKQYCEKGHRET